MAFTFDSYRRLLISCVQFYPYAPYRLNAFAEVHDALDVSKESFGATYEDYHEGRYWARDWVAGGARRDQMVAEFHAMTLYRSQLNEESNRYDVILNFVSPILSDHAKDHGEIRTRGSVLDGLFKNARYVLNYLKGCYEYEVTDPSGTSKILLHKDRADFLVSEGVYSSARMIRPVSSKVPSIEDAVIQQNTFAEFGLSDFVSCFVELEGFGCPDDVEAPSFFLTVDEEKGITASEPNE